MLTYRRLFEALNASGCDYVVVGGLAVILHGHARLTTDTDLVVDLAGGRVEALLDTLSALGFRPRAPVDLHAFADPVQRQRWIREKGMQVFSVYHASEPRWVIDLFAEPPIDFAELSARAQFKELEGVRIRIAAIEDLIAMKKLADREIDRSDIEHLNQIKDALGDWRAD